MYDSDAARIAKEFTTEFVAAKCPDNQFWSLVQILIVRYIHMDFHVLINPSSLQM